MFRLFGREVSVRVRINRRVEPKTINRELQEKLLKSYSQYNEDIFLWQLFQGKKSGTYVDIGANHPLKLSNTGKFYDAGWRGINVEPNPKLHKLFSEYRPEDTNLNCGVGDVPGEMTFYEMDPDYYSTFDAQEARKATFSTSRKVIAELPVGIKTINDIFALCSQPVDFLSVDTENFDYKVLSANDWNKNRPTAIVVELNHDENNQVSSLLQQQKYALIFFNGTNGIFVDTLSQFVSS